MTNMGGNIDEFETIDEEDETIRNGVIVVQMPPTLAFDRSNNAWRSTPKLVVGALGEIDKQLETRRLYIESQYEYEHN
jgi:hypothetical protein